MSLRIMLITAVLSLVAEPFLDISVKSLLYSTSNTIKEFLILVLPFIILLLIANGILRLRAKAFGGIILLLTVLTASNLAATWASYAASAILPAQEVQNIAATIAPLKNMWDFKLPQIITNSQAILIGLSLSVLVLVICPSWSEKVTRANTKLSEIMLRGVIMPLVPIFISGFLIKLAHSGELKPLMHQYLYTLLSFGLTASCYAVLLYALVLGRQIKKIGDMLPACITGFSTMSSNIAMPLLITAVTQNSKRRDITEPIIPYIVNFHLLGDSFFVPIMAIAIMQTNGLGFPGITEYAIFSLHFVINRFSAAAIPSGGILVMLPILASTLHFDNEMLSFITLAYALFDPFITAFNVLGNGALAMLFEKIYLRLMERNQ